MSSRRFTGEITDKDTEPLSASKRFVRSVSQKLKRKSNRVEGREGYGTTGVASNCLALYGRGGGCKVGADTGEDFRDSGGRRRSSSSVEEDGYTATCRNKGVTTVECFSYRMKERFFRWNNNRRLLKFHELRGNNRVNVHLPDDILEMCLVRLPMRSLVNARLVCKRWKNLTTTPRFVQMRKEGSFQTPWLFLFGVVKNGYCLGEIYALDVSENQWHEMDNEALKGRFNFSVASIQDDIYIVGGCSSLTNFGRVDRSSFKTHKGVLVLNPFTKSSCKAASMNYARSSPVLGILEHSSDSFIMQNQQNRQERCFYRSRATGVSEVYEDPHRLSIRRRTWQTTDENDCKPYRFSRQKSESSYNKDGSKRFLIIAVGGLGSWDEPLDSGEIYDPASDRWTEIQKLPLDFGIASSGVVSNGTFYVISESNMLAGYDVERGYWVRLRTSPSPSRVLEYHPKLISCKGRLFMIAVSWCEGKGQIGRRNKAVRKLWELDTAHFTWTEVCTHPDAPMDWNAAFVGDGDLIFGVEMFKIFGQVLDFVTMIDMSGQETWRHVSRNNVGKNTDATSCSMKSMAVLRL